MPSEAAIKLLVASVGLAGFLFGVIRFVQVQAVEAERPYLERKLAWCEEAVETTSRIATATRPAEPDAERFWQMYWGVMGLIEKEPITRAMVTFGNDLTAGATVPQLKKSSLALAHACRRELSAEWSPAWSVAR